ncbi:DUF3891 family protein [Bacillus sp. ISL-4]|uniref:DUF3891 family protein n=1 Tax=Bacillus sp. ISL-4 TaxID=2819125 RepID=UPI001BEA8253|nr:DUF3891 family protein [Bacillus sp. ISL-4]MBT2669011.1 DUF3891 family protein [Bacillus sp. ISL-4]MBT2671356.1 DUF3891 family protein [Streptomyces sp. ISL-14]
MFVSKHGNEIWLIDQYHHAIQAGEVAAYWGNDEFEAPSPSLITAVEKHDIGWVKPDKEVLFDEETGRPINFININVRQHVSFYSNGYNKVLEEDPYAGMLVGMHWIGLYTSRFGYDPTFTYKIPEDLKEFMQNVVIETQKEWINVKMKYWQFNEKRSVFEDKLWMDYEFLQLMDRMSQLVSLNTHHDKAEAVLGPVRKNQNGEGIHISVQLPGDGSVVVEPFPFKEEFETSVRVRKIHDRKYESHADLLQEIENAPYEVMSWKVRKK